MGLKQIPTAVPEFAHLMKGISGRTGDMETRFVKAQLGEQYNLFKQIKNLDKINGIQARLPYDLNIR